ncbi:MAG: flippase-like domain-containing protein [bacterium]
MASPLKELYLKIPAKIRSSMSSLIKVIVTLGAFYLLFSHQIQLLDHRPVHLEDGSTVNIVQGDRIVVGGTPITVISGEKGRKDDDGAILQFKEGQSVHLANNRAGKFLSMETVSAFRAIVNYLPGIKAATFWQFIVLAIFIKLIGVFCSILRWHYLLRGQGIRFPFYHIFGSFLIGRFIGTFLPSTIGLDGYKLYDASRFSRRTVECTAATVIEKVLGIVGLFITFLVALPFGRSILGAQATKITLMTLPIAVGVILLFFLLMFYPKIIRWFISLIPIPGKQKLEGFINRVNNAASAYKDRKIVLLNAALMSFLVHFTTAAMYYYTALAIGAVRAEFWQVTFASSIQIFATVITPFTMAGEGIREMAQYYLLRNQLGPVEAIVSAALGFWAVELATLPGAIFLWTRKKDYRPKYLFLDDKEVDFDALLKSEDYGLEELRPVSTEPRTTGWAKRAFLSRLSSGAAGGAYAGVLLGLLESIWTGFSKGFGPSMLFYGMVMYGLIGVCAGIGFGVFMGAIAVAFGRIKGSVKTYALAFSGWLSLNILILGRFLLNRDLYKEQGVPKIALLGLLLVAGLVFLIGVFREQSSKRLADPYSKRPFLWTALLLLVGLVFWGVSAAASASTTKTEPAGGIPQALADKPNIILIVCDALRADHLGCYGAFDADSPVMDKLADNGIRFHNAFSQASWTKPSVATIFSAMYPSAHKAFLKPDILPDDVETLAEVLQQAGYYTVGYPNNINVTEGFNFHQGFSEYHYLSPDYFFLADEFSSKLTYYSILRKVREGFLVKAKYPQHYYQEAAVVNRAVQEYLDRRGKNDRFFIFMHYMETHDPFFKHPFNGVGYARVTMPDPDPVLAEEMRSTYAGEVTYMDQRMGELFEYLKKEGLWDNTIVLVTADHGEEFYDHGGWWHGLTLYQEQIHIPFIFKLDAGNSRHITPTTRFDNARHVDVAPTLLGLARIPAPTSMQAGRDLFGYGEDTQRDITVFAEEDHEGNILKAFIDGPWKILNANPGNPRGLPEKELYRLDTDPRERDNRAAHEPVLYSDMQNALQAAREAALTGAVERQIRELTDDELHKMRELGYIQ